MQRNTPPTDLPTIWRDTAAELEATADSLGSLGTATADHLRVSAKTYRRLAAELEQALEAGQRRAS